MFDEVLNCPALACHFDKTLTPAGLGFVIFAIVASFLVILFTARVKKRAFIYWLLMFIGTFFFDMLTSPMSHYVHLGKFAYIYHGVSWIMIAGFTSVLFAAVNFADYALPKLLKKPLKEWQKYLWAVLLGAICLIILEYFTVGSLGVRVLSPETIRETFFKIPGTQISWLTLGWTAIISAFLISFYKYLSFMYEKRVFVPVLKARFWRNTGIALIAIVMFELMIESMVNTTGFPLWTYFFNDVSFITVICWALIIFTASWLVNRVMLGFKPLLKFLETIFVAALGLVPLEWFFIQKGFRIYSQSTFDNLSGAIIPGINMPIEVVFSAFFYLALVIAFVQYWQIILDNKNLLVVNSKKKIKK